MSAYGTGTITALNGTVSPTGSSAGTYALAVQGCSGNTLVVEASLDYVNWYQIPVCTVTTSGLGALQATITADGLYSVQAVDAVTIRARASAYTSGTINVTFYGDLVTCAPAIQNVSIISGSSGLAAAKYTLVNASGTTNITASVLYGIYNPSGSSLLSSTSVKDGSNTILPTNTILNSAPFSATFGPAGIAINSGSIAITLGGILTNPLLVVYR
jgi:hypothetical protein